MQSPHGLHRNTTAREADMHPGPWYPFGRQECAEIVPQVRRIVERFRRMASKRLSPGAQLPPLLGGTAAAEMGRPHAKRPGADTRTGCFARELRHRPDCMEPALPDTPPGEAGGRRSTRQEDPSELDPREMARGIRVAAARAPQVSAGRSPFGSSSSSKPIQGKAKGLGVV
jgi:hypothetical protein